MTDETIGSTIRVSSAVKLAGGLLVLAGIAAMLLPMATALAIEILIGITLLVAGFAEGVHAFDARRRPGVGWHFVRAALFTIAGIYLLAFPLKGIATIAFVLGILFIIEGFLRCLLYFRTHSRAIILLIDGIIGIVFGIIIVAVVPGDAAFIIALLVGFRLIMAGAVLFFVGRMIEATPIAE